MPIYEYQCQTCQHQLEALQKIADAPLQDCPACGKPELKKMVSAAAFRLKGGGWYETDFKTGGKKNLADGGKAGDSGSGNTSGSGATTASSGSSGASSPAKKESSTSSPAG